MSMLCYRILDNALCGFHIGAVAAAVAQDDGILADLGQQHKFVGDASAHHTGIGFDRHHLRYARAGKNAVVGFIAFFVVLLQIFL